MVVTTPKPGGGPVDGGRQTIAAIQLPTTAQRHCVFAPPSQCDAVTRILSDMGYRSAANQQCRMPLLSSPCAVRRRHSHPQRHGLPRHHAARRQEPGPARGVDQGKRSVHACISRQHALRGSGGVRALDCRNNATMQRAQNATLTAGLPRGCVQRAGGHRCGRPRYRCCQRGPCHQL